MGSLGEMSAGGVPVSSGCVGLKRPQIGGEMEELLCRPVVTGLCSPLHFLGGGLSPLFSGPGVPAPCGALALGKPALWPPSKARVSLASGAPRAPHTSSSCLETPVEQSGLRLQGAQEFSFGESGPDRLISRGSQHMGDSRGPQRAEIHLHVSSGL